MTTNKKTPTPSELTQQANNYVQALTEQRRRADMSQDKFASRLILDKLEEVARSMAESVKENTSKGNPQSMAAVKKMLEDAIENLVPNNRTSLAMAKTVVDEANTLMKDAVELNEQERAFLKSFSQQVEAEIDNRSKAWGRGLSALTKSFKGLDIDMKSLLVGASTNSPMIMMATKMFMQSKADRLEQDRESLKTAIDTKLEAAKARLDALSEMDRFVDDLEVKKKKEKTTTKKQKQEAAAEASEQPHTAFPTQTRSAKRTKPVTAAPAPIQKTEQQQDDEVSRQRDLARDLAIEAWMAKNPGKDLSESPFAKQDKVWEQPRRVSTQDEVQVSDEPVKEAVEELTAVVAGQSEPIRESLHQDEETNDLLHRVLGSGQQLARDMAMQDEERQSEAVDEEKQNVVQTVAGVEKGEGFMSKLVGLLFSGTTIIGMLTPIIGAAVTALGVALKAALVAVVAAMGLAIGVAIGEVVDLLAKKFLGFSPREKVSDFIQESMAKYVTDKEAYQRKPTTDANMQRLRDSGFSGTLEEMMAQSRKRNAELQARSAAARGASTTPERAQYRDVEQPTLPISGVFSAGGGYHSGDPSQAQAPVSLAGSVPMHASSPQAVAQGAQGGVMKYANQWTMSPAGLAALKRREHFKDRPYRDGKSGRWAIGYGAQEWKGRRVEDWMTENPNFKVTQAEAETELVSRINNDFRHRVHRDLGNTPLTQTQFDALTSIAYNAGHVPNNIERKLKNGEPLTRADFVRTGTERVVENGKFVGSRPHHGLMDRRGQEYDQGGFAPTSVATMAGRASATGRLAQNSQNRQQAPIVINAPVTNAPQTHIGGGSGSQPTILAVPTARNTEASLNALTRLQNGN